MRLSHLRLGSAVIGWMILAIPPAIAQCVSNWTIGDGFAGVDGPVNALTLWDPDGSGPESSRIVAGGAFNRAGTAFCRVASWDGTQWTPIGNNDAGEVRALCVLPDGRLVAAFTSLPSVGRAVAQWTGSAWQPLGDPAGLTDGIVNTLLVTGDGSLVAGGSFRTIAGVRANRVARWTGANWAPLGNGVSADADWSVTVNALATMPNGDILAGGNFVTNTPGNVPAQNIARWNGQVWLPVGNRQGGFISSLAVTPNGHILAGGSFFSQVLGFYVYLSRWDGSQWSGLPGPPLVTGYPALAIDPWQGNSLLAAWSGAIWRWTGSSWSLVAQGIQGDFSSTQGVAAVLPLPNADVAIGGNFQTISGLPAKYLGRWSSSAPVIVTSPTPQQLCSGSSLTLTVAANSAQALTYSWRRGTQLLTDGAQVNGGIVQGAATATLTILGVTPGDAGVYFCTVTDLCASVTSSPAQVVVTPCCPSDLNHDGIVNDDDFVIFVQAYNQVLCP